MNVSVDDLLRIIGHKQVIIEQQERMIAELLAKIKQLEDEKKAASTPQSREA